MPHIAMVIPSLAGGGAERTALRVAGGLAARGHRVDIVLFAPHVAYPGEVPEAARLFVLCGRRAWARRNPPEMPAGVQWRPERAPLLQGVGLAAGLVRDFPAAAPVLLRRAALGRARRLARYAAREKPDILFANLAQAEHAAFYAARLAGPRAFPPIVPVMRNVEASGTHHTKRRRLLFPAAARVVAISGGWPRMSPRSSACLWNGSSPSTIRPTRQTSPARGRGGRPPLVRGRRPACGARRRPPRAAEGLSDADRSLPARAGGAPLPAGHPRRGADAHELEGRVRALGLEAHVSLPGWAENPWACMARARLFVLSSRHEGFGNVLVEALACGCPAVSTDCPAGPAEILEDPALLAPVGDPEALAQVMLQALARPVDKEALRATAARFSMESAVEGYDGVVERVLWNRARADICGFTFAGSTIKSYYGTIHHSIAEQRSRPFHRRDARPLYCCRTGPTPAYGGIGRRRHRPAALYVPGGYALR